MLMCSNPFVSSGLLMSLYFSNRVWNSLMTSCGMSGEIS